MSNIFSDLEKMQEFYLDTERQLIEISHVIPFYNDSHVYSPRLYNILQSTCGQIENMMRLICKRYNILPDKDNPSFWDYYPKININNILSRQKILFKRTKNILTPFVIEIGYSPNWWKKYNKTKHNLPDGIIEGNMGNTINAVSALYSLHHMSNFLSAPLDALQNYDNWQDSRISGDEDQILFNAITSEDSRIFDSEIFYAITRYYGRQ